MTNSGLMLFVELFLFGVVFIAFAAREVWLNSPKQIAKQEEKERLKREAEGG